MDQEVVNFYGLSEMTLELAMIDCEKCEYIEFQRTEDSFLVLRDNPMTEMYCGLDEHGSRREKGQAPSSVGAS